MRKRLWHCIRPLGKPLSRVGITIVCASQSTANLLPCHTRALTLSVPPRRFSWGLVGFPANSPTCASGARRGRSPSTPPEPPQSPSPPRRARGAQRRLILPGWVILLREGCAVVALTMPSEMQMNHAGA